ncbi:MAG: PqqD family protein [Lachnospiraceae bacterium]|nr:PqqD family protein [Lachnospiraceae bacterium]
MKLKDQMILSSVGGEPILVSAGTEKDDFHGVIKLNKSGAFLAECLKEGADEEELLRKLKTRFEGDEEQMRKDIRMLLDRFAELNLLEET